MYLDSFEPIHQQTRNNCFPVTIKIILDHLCIKHNKPYMKLSVKNISKLSNYDGRFGVFDSDLAVSSMNTKHFKNHGYIINEKSGSTADIKLIKKILDDGNCSAPIVTVHPQYFKEENKNYTVPEDPDCYHQLVIRNMDGNNIKIVDTLTPIAKQDNAEISLSNFISYWDGAKRSLLWIERIKTISSLNPQQKKLTDATGALIKR